MSTGVPNEECSPEEWTSDDELHVRSYNRLQEQMSTSSSLQHLVMQSGLEQRGLAAHLRQHDDNSKRTVLKAQERKFLNRVIHDPSMNDRPDFVKRLEQLAASNLPPSAHANRRKKRNKQKSTPPSPLKRADSNPLVLSAATNADDRLQGRTEADHHQREEGKDINTENWQLKNEIIRVKLENHQLKQNRQIESENQQMKEAIAHMETENRIRSEREKIEAENRALKSQIAQCEYESRWLKSKLQRLEPENDQLKTLTLRLEEKCQRLYERIFYILGVSVVWNFGWFYHVCFLAIAAVFELSKQG